MDQLVDAYLRRIKLAAAGGLDAAGLRALLAAHVAAIPFENLDILLGRPIRLDLEHLVGKLIVQRRGGYCFEQNSLLLAVLRELGFEAAPMEARVRAGAGETVRPRTHMTLVVRIDGAEWLADAGFGGLGPREPVPMDGTVCDQGAGLAYRVVRDGDLRVLQMRQGREWSDQYAFLPHVVYPVDFVVANWFTSTWPDSPFVRTLTAQRATLDTRCVLRYPSYTEVGDSRTLSRDIERGELMPLLRSVFLIDLPDDTVFPAIDAVAPALR